ncbi:MAG TPA: bifunctional phosphoribosylaminoimidazolecarboxamide formyltransferase/IMP cyclohydrolase [Candidatus Yaniella excrementavium]|nr:bifunctional phosphoribosylaminoimidazolecarboxamide formyltransferase/IMP cyclohydrolase [Candidatus Yaniella excrementavium]
MLDQIPVKRALLSVYDKSGLAELAQGLSSAGVEIVSTGSTAAMVQSAGVPVTEVSQVTGFPEVLGGRVKTLHPFIHAGVLADKNVPDHMNQLTEHDIAPFDLVVVNLYPFVETVTSGATQREAIEQIDIGGPTMVRAAAKNHGSVAIVTNPEAYHDILTAVANGGFSLEDRRRLAVEAFAHTASYDTAVAAWMAENFDDADHPAYTGHALELKDSLRYGENPHQPAAIYTAATAAPGIAQANLLHGKAMSFNNYVDADAAVRAAYAFTEPAVSVIKHANPCGLGVASNDANDAIADAHRKAHATDPVSAFGGVIAANRTVSAAMAQQVKDIFTEVVVAPGFSPEAREVLSAKKNIRLLELPEGFVPETKEFKQVSGGMLVQDSDIYQAAGDDPVNWELAAGQPADEQTMQDLVFAWQAVRAPKSNAILLASNRAAVGIGMGQVNRLDSCRLAIERANTLGAASTGAQDVSAPGGAENVSGAGAPDRATGSVAASDAFFPFADGLQILIDAGVRAVVQPGGSMRDNDVIEAANAAGVTMYLTGARHFYHG